jgi:hypothetical protein
MNLIKATSKALLFVAGFILFYVTVLFALSSLNLNGLTLLQRLTGNTVAPGGWGHSLLRFRELENIAAKTKNGNYNLDIIIIGSSHAYRGFDPRLFKERGYSSFNMGSTAQSPMNSYYLLKYYLPKVKPKAILLELYPVVFAIDGYESTLDLLSNLSFSWELMEMSWSTGNLHAIVNCLQKLVGDHKYPVEKFNQKTIENDTYIPGGYVETSMVREVSRKETGREIRVLENQLNYFSKILELAKNYNITVVGVIQPLPDDYLRSIVNFKAVVNNLRQIATKYKVDIYDFNGIVNLDPRLDYEDRDHLNKSGVLKFNKALIDKLVAIKVLNSRNAAAAISR